MWRWKHRTHAAAWAAAARAEPVDSEQISPAMLRRRCRNGLLASDPAANSRRPLILTARDAQRGMRASATRSWRGARVAPPKALPLRSIYDVTRDVILDPDVRAARAADMRHAIESTNSTTATCSRPSTRIGCSSTSLRQLGTAVRVLGCAIPAARFRRPNHARRLPAGYADLRAHARGRAAATTRS